MLRTAAAEMSWHRRAQCREMPSEVFYPPDNEKGARRRRREQRAKCICLQCPVRGECLAHALRWPETYGIWGGTTPYERIHVTASKGVGDAGNGLAESEDLDALVRIVRSHGH
jgi:WhiB family redox-sensing transcriptional regulator